MVKKLALAVVAAAFLVVPVLAQTTPAPTAPATPSAGAASAKTAMTKKMKKPVKKPKRFGGGFR